MTTPVSGNAQVSHAQHHAKPVKQAPAQKQAAQVPQDTVKISAQAQKAAAADKDHDGDSK
jgi:hypothetical protein